MSETVIVRCSRDIALKLGMILGPPEKAKERVLLCSHRYFLVQTPGAHWGTTDTFLWEVAQPSDGKVFLYP
jgi:hypothetical protein